MKVPEGGLASKLEPEESGGSRILPSVGRVNEYRFGGISLPPIKISSPNWIPIRRKWGPAKGRVVSLEIKAGVFNELPPRLEVQQSHVRTWLSQSCPWVHFV